MNQKRIIACLDIKGGKIVKGVHFTNLKEAGDVVELSQYYAAEGVDELALLDIASNQESRAQFLLLVEKVASLIDIPIIVGGGIGSLEEAKRVFNAGASKISVSSMAVKNPPLINELATQCDSSSLICAIDVKSNPTMKSKWELYTSGGTYPTNKDALEWALEVQKRGAGEILLTSMDHDGTKEGFAVDLCRLFSTSLNIPIIASGGAGNMEHFVQIFKEGRVSGALAASIFHFREVEIGKLKIFLAEHGIDVGLHK